MKNLDLPETARGLVQPVTKLVDAVSGASGKIYEPTHVKRMANAKAQEIKVIAETIRQNSDIPIVYRKSGIVSIDNVDFEKLAKRTGERLKYQEIKKQQNIEAVVDKSYEILKDEKEVSNKPVDQDWMTRFINSIEDVSNEEMQKIWANILAGEVKKPESFSLRTLEAIKNLTQDDAVLFEKISNYFILTSVGAVLPNVDVLLKKFDINYGQILHLDNCGLLNSSSSICLKLSDQLEKGLSIGSGKIAIVIKRTTTENIASIKFEPNVYILTDVGQELLKAIDLNIDDDFVLEYGAELRNEYSKLQICAHKIIGKPSRNNIDYEDSDLLPPIKCDIGGQ